MGPQANRRPSLRNLIRPLRRFAAWFSLVNEETTRRDESVHDLELRHSHRFYEHDRYHEKDASQLNHRIFELEEAVSRLNDLLDKGVGARADATLSQLWRRMEGADA